MLYGLPARASRSSSRSRGVARHSDEQAHPHRWEPTCSLWLARCRLVAVLVGPASYARRAIRVALTDDARYGLLEYLAALEAEIVVTEALARTDPLPSRAARRGVPTWTVDDGFAAALLGAAAIRDPARAAGLLARLPRIPVLRAWLRRLMPPGAPTRQLPLLWSVFPSSACAPELASARVPP